MSKPKWKSKFRVGQKVFDLQTRRRMFVIAIQHDPGWVVIAAHKEPHNRFWYGREESRLRPVKKIKRRGRPGHD